MAQASAATRKKAASAARPAERSPPSPRRQRMTRDIALIFIAPALLYLVACLAT